MKFATFYRLSTGYVARSIPPRYSADHVKPTPALGSDGVAIFDGRFSVERCAAEARIICRKRGFVGFTIEAGEAFTRARLIRAYEGI